VIATTSRTFLSTKTTHIHGSTCQSLSSHIRRTSSLPSVVTLHWLLQVIAQGQNYTSGCTSLCDHVDSVVNGSCSSIGCCQTSIPQGVTDFTMVVTSLNNHSMVHNFNPCGFGFVVEEKAYNFSSLDLQNLQNRETVPVVLDWAVGNETCQDAQRNQTSYACKAANSECYNSTNGPGYRCNCSSGFQGNPYLLDGCQGTNLHLFTI
jgi:hypothetical protein